MQIHHAILERVEDDVAAILGNRGTDAGFQQLLDLRDDLVVFVATSFVARRPMRYRRIE